MANIKNVSLSAPTDFGVRQQAIERNRKLAEALQQQSMEPLQGQVAPGGLYVPPHWAQGAAKLAQALVARKQMDFADQEQQVLSEQSKKALVDGLNGYQRVLQGEPAQNFQVLDDEHGPQTATAPAVPGNRQEALIQLLRSEHPLLQQMGTQMMLKEPESENVVVGRSLVNRSTGKVIGTDATWIDEQKAAREAKAAELESRLADQRTSREERAALQRELTQMRIDAQRDQARLVAGLRQSDNKPYVTPVQTAQGVMAFNHRTGQMEPVMINGKPVIGSGSDPTLQGQITSAKQKGEAEAKRDFNMGGASDIMDRAEGLLTGKQKPTASVVGNVVDKAAGIFGASPAGAAEAEELKVLGGYLVSKMPRMEGPQSNFDVQNYKEMAGDVGNPNLPIERRIAALKQLRGIIAKYDKNTPAIGAALPSRDAIDAELARRAAAKGK